MYTTKLLIRSIVQYRTVVSTVLFLVSSSLSALELNGLSAHTELNKTLYIGALYLNEPSSDEAAVRALATGKMEIRVNAERISSRKFNKLLVEALAINNPEDVFSSHIDDVVKLSQIAKDNLQQGDRLTIVAEASSPVTVLLNDKKLTSFENASFFNMLLNIWVGEVPPSSNFKNEILAGGKEVSPTLLEQFNTLTPESSRQDLVAVWNKPATPTTKAKAPAPVQKPKPAPIRAENPVAKAVIPTPKPSPQALPPAENEPVVVEALPTKPQEKLEKSEPVQTAPQEQEVALNTAAPVDVLPAEVDEAEAIAAAEDTETNDELEERREKNKRFLQSMRRR